MGATVSGAEAVIEREDDVSLGPEEYYGEYLGVGIKIKRLGRNETLDDFAIYSDRTDETLPEDAYYLGAFTVPRVAHPSAIRLAARYWLEKNKLDALRRLIARHPAGDATGGLF
jgi:hypothetical protein